MGVSGGSDFIVIGAGIAGASAAAHLAERGRVVVLEAEAHAGYHSTGRSAALFSEIYGNAVIRALSRASRPFLFDPPAGFSPTALVHPRDVMYFARPDQLPVLRRRRLDGDILAGTIELTADEAHARVPILLRNQLGGAMLEQGSADIDVDALHQGFLRAARAKGAQVIMNSGATRIERTRGQWTVHTAQGNHTAPVLVNAAGAWGDAVAQLAGVAPVGLQPMRRTALLIDTPGGLNSAQWPAAIDIEETFYFKPDAGLLLLSPADEDPCPACDVQPEDIDVAIAVDRFERATGTQVRQVKRRWAGLRVFSPDRSPVVGFDTRVEGFFWLVGQGGYGIQTAAAMGRVAAALASHAPLPDDVVAMGVDAAMLSRARFEASGTAELAEGVAR